MPLSYFRRKAAQSYRRARSSLTPHLDYEALMSIGHAFKAKAVLAADRLERLRGTALRKQKLEHPDTRRESRE
jgi:hypothetical protein